MSTSPTKDNNKSFNNNERTANTAISSNFANFDEKDEEEIQEHLRYKDLKMLRKVVNIKDEYSLGQVIGTGTYGVVVEAVHLKFKLKCAIKIMTKEKLFKHQSRIENLENELRVLNHI